MPGELGIRFATWQELVAEPRSTYSPPCASILNGCIGWSPVSGSPETITSGDPLGATAPAGRASIVRLCIECAFIKRDPGAAGIAAFGAGTEADDHVGASVAGGVLQREQESAGGRRILAVIG